MHHHRKIQFLTCLSLFFFLSEFSLANDFYLPPLASSGFDRTLTKKLAKAAGKKKGSYAVRTQLRKKDGSAKYINRLILEDSPYLLQHAHTPVNWYAWGEEAFKTARKHGKAVFLSIGYSTCHWCHVMEEESFDNEKIAALLNENFISIKVDREQLPEIDEIYMTGAKIISGRSGWPMSSFLTDAGKPFYAGTYFDPEAFTKLILRVKTLWRADKEKLLAVADRVTQSIQKVHSAAKSADSLDKESISRAVQKILQRVDFEKGGFSGAPKFPNESTLLFLLEKFELDGDKRILQALDVTLSQMARGGIYDHIGGGFHRYSTDAQWLIPHFEKMLYTQAQMLRIYSRMSALTGDPFYAIVAHEIAEFVLRDMRADDDTFYSAIDADSEGKEGAYYTWHKDQIRKALDTAESKLVSETYGISDRGNFEGSNILHLPRPLSEVAQTRKIDTTELIDRLSPIKKKLRKKRDTRITPLIDEKVITSWNGLMITALSDAAIYLNEPRYLEAALKAAEQIWRSVWREKSELKRIKLNRSVHTSAVLEDYAYLAEAFITIHSINGDKNWRQKAEKITDKMIHFFRDDDGGFFIAKQQSQGPKIVRSKTIRDSALPSPSAVAYRNLSRLDRLSIDGKYKEIATNLLATSAGQIKNALGAHAYFLAAVSENSLTGAKRRAYISPGIGNAMTTTSRINNAHTTLSLVISLEKGWHINANRPRQDYLIGTTLELARALPNLRLEQVEYPEAIEWQVRGFKKPLKVFENTFTIKANFFELSNMATRDKTIPLKLRLQACNDRHCLPPETLRFNSVY